MGDILVCKPAPDFCAPAVLANGSIDGDYRLSTAIKNKYGLLFFYPLDFTFVCPSELIDLHNRIEEFKALNVEVIAVSIDSQFTHTAWRNTPIKEGGIGPVAYTMVADIGHSICQSYGVEHEKAKVALRAAFLINSQGIVCSQTVNDLPIGRNMDELLRLVHAVQFFEMHGEVCPAGWTKGSKGMKASAEGVKQYLAGHAADL